MSDGSASHANAASETDAGERAPKDGSTARSAGTSGSRRSSAASSAGSRERAAPGDTTVAAWSRRDWPLFRVLVELRGQMDEDQYDAVDSLLHTAEALGGPGRLAADEALVNAEMSVVAFQSARAARPSPALGRPGASPAGVTAEVWNEWARAMDCAPSPAPARLDHGRALTSRAGSYASGGASPAQRAPSSRATSSSRRSAVGHAATGASAGAADADVDWRAAAAPDPPSRPSAFRAVVGSPGATLAWPLARPAGAVPGSPPRTQVDGPQPQVRASPATARSRAGGASVLSPQPGTPGAGTARQRPGDAGRLRTLLLKDPGQLTTETSVTSWASKLLTGTISAGHSVDTLVTALPALVEQHRADAMLDAVAELREDRGVAMTWNDVVAMLIGRFENPLARAVAIRNYAEARQDHGESGPSFFARYDALRRDAGVAHYSAHEETDAVMVLAGRLADKDASSALTAEVVNRTVRNEAMRWIEAERWIGARAMTMAVAPHTVQAVAAVSTGDRQQRRFPKGPGPNDGCSAHAGHQGKATHTNCGSRR
jgi:hypothetical protein